LREYSGTVIAVSHDRYFLRQIVNRVVEVKNEKLIDYVGDYNVRLPFPTLLRFLLPFKNPDAMDSTQLNH